MSGLVQLAVVGASTRVRLTKRRRVLKIITASLLIVSTLGFAYADIAVTPSQPGLAEWRDAGPGTNTQGSGTRFSNSTTAGSGTVTGNLHVLRVQVKASFTTLPTSCEVWAGALGRGVDAASHSTVKSLTYSGNTYTCVALANTNSTVSPLFFHVSSPSAEQTETVRYFVKDTSTGYWFTASTEYLIKRFDCHDAGIDTRQTYGDPNVEGRIEANPNNSARTVVFTDWTYRGGLFAGHMPWEASPDRSGVGRIQFYYDPSSTTIHASTLTLFRKGHNNSGESYSGGTDPDLGTPSLGVFKPLSGDTNLYASGTALEAGSKWSTRLTITPSGVGSGTFRWDQNPISVPTVYLKNEYVNFPLDKYGEDGSLISSTQTHATKHLIVALADESGLSSTGTIAWRYFTSREYQAMFSTGIYSDSRPRVWTMTVGTPTAFTQQTVTE